MVDKITNPPSQKDLIDKVNEIIDDKQDTLVSGTNIKTINNTSILGSGNIDIYTAGTGIDITNDVISVTSDISTGAALGATAVQPADLASVATSGSYNDLSNKPDLNGKADVDLSNINTAGKSFVSGLGMPSSRYIDLTIGAHGSSYTAPANGWFAIRGYAASGAFLWLSNNSNQAMQAGSSYTSTAKGGVCIPCKRGDTASIGYYGGKLDFVRFIYAEGEN